MSKFELSIFDPNTLLPHRAGIAGLALALSDLDPTDAPMAWEVNEDTVSLSWDCSDKEAITWLMQQTYQQDKGLLISPSLALSQQGKFTFSQGVLSTFLQHFQQKSFVEDLNKPKKGKKKFYITQSVSLSVDPDKPDVTQVYTMLEDCYYLNWDQKDLNVVFNKGSFRPTIKIKGHHLPGLVECYVNGEYEDSPSGFIALLFLPLACSYFQLPSVKVKSADGKAKLIPTYSIVIPEIRQLTTWVHRRKMLSGIIYRDFRASSGGESGLRFLLQEKLNDSFSSYRVNYCEVYRLGSQPWDKNQSGLKQSVYRVSANEETLDIYQIASQYLPPIRLKVKEQNKPQILNYHALAWIADNLISGKSWYTDFFVFSKIKTEKEVIQTDGSKKKIQIYKYERKGLIAMTSHLQPYEQTLFDSVQGAFSVYLVGQSKQANKQGRPLDYVQVTDKVIHRLQRPSTQQEFATALVDFLSQFRSKAARGLGREIYAWIHGEEWRKARDLTMLAIATYQSKKKDGDANSEEELVEIPDSDSVVEADDEGYEESL